MSGHEKQASSWLAAACLLALAAAPVQAAEQVATGRVSVVDGDTLELHGERIRLAAIDAPEARQSCLRAASPGPAAAGPPSRWPTSSARAR